ncbi:MAG: anti-phage dCTP deaminase [Rhizobium rhizophilum]|uniref:anti-phage dCTP deaminase n=1 Tax=Rhizobium rhizophilum TaxID=1850373 RepID=UPI0039193284
MATQTFPKPEKNLPEIFIGIVSPVGTGLKSTIDALTKEFNVKGYNVHHIKISDQFPAISDTFGYTKLNTRTRYDRIDTYINFGNYLRNQLGGRALSAFAISQIAEKRSEDKTRGDLFIIDQLKTEQELDLLREVYGNCFFQLSVYSARDVRVDNLANTMAHDNKKRDANFFRGKAETLVARDEDEFNEPNGQKVGKIFQYADVVINADRADDHNNVPQQVRRFVELLFGHNGYSPNRLEYGMYLAHSAALRSLDLSRQVGAAIFRKTGEIAALGANEVPKAGGGTYWADDPFDAREYKLGSDSNDKRKNEILDEVIEIISGGNPTLTKDKIKQLEKSQFMDALEYGRIVHAEMSALSDAARLGISVNDATIYCTTFPCHMCAKHIVASGISKVVFLEPYPKSLTSDLHSDSVKIEGMSRGAYGKFPAVEFAPFFGITPRRYREFFHRVKRKSGIEFEDYRNNQPIPMVRSNLAAYLPLETETFKALKQSITQILEKPRRRKNPPTSRPTGP